ncbi:NADH-quinone oxidoreductase subunit J [Salaquimonas pukyongi]|uniref:NADH-quinone oxidoreductase subunit J n=1 Tax=Salaquimonas pukyongi TaxID=2712698 RepID=UPI00096BBD07|nr:NADH-quinone oxidoreductase subunit J [Salaquimonas pukyongi]
MTAIFFYLFATITVASAFMVISARNPVHAVLFLILAFVNSAGLFMLTGAEFLALLLIVVYVGAVAVLFLFVVMMLDVDFVELREGFLQYLPIGGLVGAIVLVELLMVVGAWVVAPGTVDGALGEPTPDMSVTSNIQALGNILYTKYFFFFQVAGLILLVAMIGAIVLTLHHRPDVRRQDISKQVARSKETAIEIKKVESGKGI